MLRQGRNSRTTGKRVPNCLYRLTEGSAVMAQAGAVRARARVTKARKLREAAAAVAGTQSWCAQLRQWQGRRR